MSAPVPDHVALPVEELRRRLNTTPALFRPLFWWHERCGYVGNSGEADDTRPWKCKRCGVPLWFLSGAVVARTHYGFPVFQAEEA